MASEGLSVEAAMLAQKISAAFVISKFAKEKAPVFNLYFNGLDFVSLHFEGGPERIEGMLCLLNGLCGIQQID